MRKCLYPVYFVDASQLFWADPIKYISLLDAHVYHHLLDSTNKQ